MTHMTTDPKATFDLKASMKQFAKDSAKRKRELKKITHSLEEDESLPVKPKKKMVATPNNLPDNWELYIPGSSQTMDTEKKSEENTGDDFYSTLPRDISALLEKEQFIGGIWEPACWDGAISNILVEKYWNENVYSSDLTDRGFWNTGIDFLQTMTMPENCVNIITNPPSSLTKEFIEQWLSLLPEWWKLALLLKSSFCDEKEKESILGTHLPKIQYTFKRAIRFKTPIGNTKDMYFSWFVWEKWLEDHSTYSQQLWPRTAKYLRNNFTS